MAVNPPPLELPPRIRELAEIIGLQPALLLVEKYGGAKFYVPRTVAADHSLAELLGAETARKLAAEFGGSMVWMPRYAKLLKLNRDREIRAQSKAGASGYRLALKFKLTDRHVRRILGDDEIGDPRQPRLL